jgi:hypothetical protein
MFGDRGTLLDEQRVPEGLLSLLPYASLFDTGEEGMWERYGKTLGARMAEELCELVAQHDEAIQAFIDTRDDTEERYAFLNLHSMCYLLGSIAAFEASKK